jgi:MYXO-CTERM domain-containing protein
MRSHRRICAGAAGGIALVLFCAPSARAHFALEAPPSWMSQDNSGLPEKLGPCGDEDDGTDAATPTGIVTAFQAGQTITVTINELVFHPGHYRIALAVNDRADLPAEPPVTAGATPCGTTTVEDPPVFPVLADDVFDHTAPFTAPQSVQITLPSDVTCTKCTLQVIEFMSDHPLNNPGGCFYHHCADISIAGTTVSVGDSGADAGTDAGASSGCGCTVAGQGGAIAPPLLGLALAAGLFRRQRARRRLPPT